jgi:hypothetical protein
MRTRLWVPGLLLVLGASVASAAPITIPQDLAPGTVYHIAFVSSGSHNAVSTDIADYDAFVTAQANLVPELAALNTTWRVIGSTETVDAIDHVGVVGPVYNTRGQLVTDTLAHMFSGLSGLSGVIGYYQDGGFFVGNEYVWTGTGTDGRKSVGAQYLGGPTTQLPPICILNPFTGELECQQMPNYLGPIVGIASATNSFDFSWITETNIFSTSTPLAFYGISGALTVPFPDTDPPSPVPEPATMSLMLSPLAFLALRRVRRARR